MQERGINSTFRKLIYEASEMVFLADATFPYPIFYSNKSFEENIGAHLTDKSLVGLGLDIDSFLLKDKLIFVHDRNDYEFFIEHPQDVSSNHFLFYNGKRIKTQELLTNKDSQQFLLESPNAQIIVNLGGEIFHANTEALSLFGKTLYNSNIHLRELVNMFAGSQDWETWISSAISLSETHQFSSTLIRATSDPLILEIASKHLLIEGIQYVIFSFQNSFERVLPEKNLKDSSNFLWNLTEQVPGGLFQVVIKSEGEMKFSFLSKGIENVLGLKTEEIESFTHISMAISRVHPLDLQQVIMSSIASANNMEPWQFQFRVKSDLNSEEYKWIMGAARQQELENEDVVWYGFLTDISLQKEFEATLDESRRTAEKANQIKSDFLSMISHELRTPLNAIAGSIYSLLQDESIFHQRSELETINFAVDNLIIMINDLLDFQKIEAGKLTIEKAPFHLGSSIKQIVNGMTFHARDSNNKLTLIVSERLNFVVAGDKTRISQVLNNLITNALKFTDEGEVKVIVELVESHNGKARVYFEVKDDGIGIALEHQKMIFNNFDQVRPTFSTKYGGTGLGLSITKKLLNLMGAEIGVQSKLNEGSSFFFELEFEIAEIQVEKTSITTEYSSPSSSLHLLVAEDNDVNALVLGKILDKWGFTYEHVYNGLEAVRAVKHTNFDCILMDIQMPEMDGFDATLAIKKISETPVIALTAAARLQILDRIEECDFDGFVAKPIDASKLRKIIQEVLLERNQSV
ncbi:signal transduction histidine kinase [Algoriphagus ratkowskyi]|uniref:histidine kinase n=1 Tax=Algoriphagus ratkowskyi TaxID=57028 RepID=A0A2W7SEG8_9BACT|nr:ATP-binding protein [Algoriphagus ratkowskyi]PZX61235.1 signal transduction histidine kinase [Algoriphagus ratkowskyi]TXD79351.1 response regulator [Algoriphagus ratkowskyi]